MRTQHEGSTDHSPVLLTLATPRDPTEEATFVKRSTDWERFRAAIQRHGAPSPVIETEGDLERAIQILEDDIHTALGHCTTETEVRRFRNPRGELPLEIKQLIRERRAAKTRALRTQHPVDKRTMNQPKSRVEAALDEHAQERWRSHIETLDPMDKSLWKTRKTVGEARKKIKRKQKPWRTVWNSNVEKTIFQTKTRITSKWWREE